MTLAEAVDWICHCVGCDRRSALKQLRNALGDRNALGYPKLQTQWKKYKPPPIEYEGLRAGYNPPEDARFWQKALIRRDKVFDRICKCWRTLLILKEDVFRLWREPSVASVGSESGQAAENDHVGPITKAKIGRPSDKDQIYQALDHLQRGHRVKEMAAEKLAKLVASHCGKQLGEKRWDERTVLGHIQIWREEH
jgi:hypothetical protein